MKRSLPLVAVFFFSLLLASFSIGFSVNEPSQQSNKIYYAPYYVPSMTQNVNTTFNLPINPPDGISEVKSAVLNFQVYGAPTITFTLYANNKSCNPASFSIATTYASTGLLSFAFDCSNVIKSAGNYTLKMAPSKTTGATYGWMDFVYVNNPNGQMEVKGTEYFAGDRGTVFLQLVDAYGQPINTAACFTDIYYPYSYDLNHTAFVEDVPMLYKEEGLYYYDFVVPPYTGVYMVLGKCRYGRTDYRWLNDLSYFPSITATTGTIAGDPQVLDSYLDGLYVKHTDAGDKVGLNVTISNLTESNVSAISFSGFFNAEKAGTVTASVWNYTSGKWVALGTTSAIATGAGVSAQNDYFGFSLNVANASQVINGGVMKFWLNSTGTGVVWWNALWASVYSFDEKYVPIYGSGELHISSESASPLIVSTLCGDSTSDCAVFYNNFTNYPYPEGSIYDNVTVLAQETGDFEWIYETPSEVDCTAFNRILFRNSTNASWTELSFAGFNQKTTTQKNCALQIPLNATRGQTYYYYLDYGNYMKYGTRENINLVRKINSTAFLYCSQYSHDWSVPILHNHTVPVSSDELDTTIILCHQIFDGAYWSETYYAQGELIDTAGNYQQALIEGNYYQEKLFRSVTSLLKLTSINNLTSFNTSVTVNANLTQVLTDIASTNRTVHSAMSVNFSQISTEHSQILSNLSSVNLSIQTVSNKIDLLSSALNFMNATLHSAFVGNFTQAFNTLFDIKTEIEIANQSVHTALENNFTNTNAIIISTNNTPVVDLTPIINDIQSTNATLHDSLNNLNLSTVSNDISSLNSSLSIQIAQVGNEVAVANASLHTAIEANFTQTNGLIVSTNNTPNITVDLTPVLSAIGSTNESLHGAIAINATETNNLIISVNNTPVANLTPVLSAISSAEGNLNLSIQTVQSDVQNSNSTLHSAIVSVNNTPNITVDFTPILSAINATNISLTNEIVSGNAGTVQAVAYVYELINSTNSTIHSTLTSMQSDLSNLQTQMSQTNQSIHNAIYDNFTNTNNLISGVNSGILGYLGSNFTLVNANLQLVNTSLSNEIQTSKSEILSALAVNSSAILGDLSVLSGDVLAVNNTLYTLVLPDLAGIRGDISSANVTIHSALANNFSIVLLDIASTNGTLHYAIASEFANTNGLITALDGALFNNFSTINGLIKNTNDTLHSALASNGTAILSLSYSIQSDIQNANSTLLNALNSGFYETQSQIQNTNSTLTTLINGIAFYFDGLFGLHDTNMANNFTQTNNLILAVNGTVGTCPTANTISNTVWSAPSRTLTEWSTVIPAIWGSEENNCKVKTVVPVQTVGNTENEPAGYKVGNTESGSDCGIGCRVSGFVNSIFGG